MIDSRWLTLPSAALLALTAACGSAKPCDGVAGTCKELTPGADVAGAFATATAGTTLAFGEGTFTFTNALSLQAKNVTIKGAGMDKTILDFKGQAAGAEGIGVLDGSDGITMTDFTVRDSKGDGIKVIGSIGVTFRNVKALWTSADKTGHGKYGLYPVQSKKVLIDSCRVEGAADAGIYVGQSDGIIVKNSTALNNVAGIEIENSFNADVFGNTATGNTSGILVFDLPGLPQKGGHNVRVFNNTVKNDNGDNFADPSGTVALVPAGVGLLVMANRDVEVFGNTVTGNNSTGIAVVSFYVTQVPITDPNYYPVPSKVNIHDNVFNVAGDTSTLNGKSPDPSRDLGLLLAGFKAAFPGGRVADILYDGIVDANATGGTATNKMQFCAKNNTAAATFTNLHMDLLKPDGSNLAQIMTTDGAPYDCTLPALPAVSF